MQAYYINKYIKKVSLVPLQIDNSFHGNATNIKNIFANVCFKHAVERVAVELYMSCSLRKAHRQYY